MQFKSLEPFRAFCKGPMSPRMIRRFCKLDAESEKRMENTTVRLGLSAKAYDRILRAARTMADLEGFEKIQVGRIAAPIHYRSLDRTDWQ